MFDGNVNNTKQVKHLYSSFLNVDIFWFLYSETAKWIVLGCGQNKKFEGCIRKYFSTYSDILQIIIRQSGWDDERFSSRIMIQKQKQNTHKKLITDVQSYVRPLVYSESPKPVISWRHGLYKNTLNQMCVITTDSQPRTTGRWCYHHVFILFLSRKTSWKTFIKEKNTKVKVIPVCLYAILTV